MQHTEFGYKHNYVGAIQGDNRQFLVEILIRGPSISTAYRITTF